VAVRSGDGRDIRVAVQVRRRELRVLTQRDRCRGYVGCDWRRAMHAMRIAIALAGMAACADGSNLSSGDGTGGAGAPVGCLASSECPVQGGSDGTRVLATLPSLNRIDIDPTGQFAVMVAALAPGSPSAPRALASRSTPRTPRRAKARSSSRWPHPRSAASISQARPSPSHCSASSDRRCAMGYYAIHRSRDRASRGSLPPRAPAIAPATRSTADGIV
jgi:hypothetical protein